MECECIYCLNHKTNERVLCTYLQEINIVIETRCVNKSHWSLLTLNKYVNQVKKESVQKYICV